MLNQPQHFTQGELNDLNHSKESAQLLNLMQNTLAPDTYFSWLGRIISLL